jgi:hypothetical protein
MSPASGATLPFHGPASLTQPLILVVLHRQGLQDELSKANQSLKVGDFRLMPSGFA